MADALYHQLALCGTCFEHVRDGNARVAVCEMWVVASTGHLVRYNCDGLGVGKRRGVLYKMVLTTTTTMMITMIYIMRTLTAMPNPYPGTL